MRGVIAFIESLSEGVGGLAALVVMVTIRFYYVMPAVLFSAYVLYGLLVRPFLPKRLRKGLEEPEDPDGGEEEIPDDLGEKF